MQHLVKQALAPEASGDDPLYRAALEVEQDERLAAGTAEWDGTAADRLEASKTRHG